MRRVAGLAVGIVALLGSGCALRPTLGTEDDSGRRAIIWNSQGSDSAEAPTSPAQATPPDTERERKLRAAVRAADEVGREDLALATTLYELAIARRQQGAFDEAAALYGRALAIREGIQGSNHRDVATVLNNLAAVEVARENYEAARPLLERALTIRQQALGDQDPLTVQSVNNLALLYAAQGNAAAAEPLYQRAIAAMEKTDPPHRDNLDRVLDNYAALLRDTGRDTEADRIEARAGRVRATR